MKIHLVLAPLTLLAGFPLGRVQESFPLLPLLLVSACSYLILHSVLFLGWLATYKLPRFFRAQNWVLALTGMAAGAAKAVTTELVASDLFAQPLSLETLISRVATSATTFGLAVPLVAEVAKAVREHREIRDQMLRELVDEEVIRRGLLANGQPDLNSLDRSLQQMLQASFDPIHEMISMGKFVAKIDFREQVEKLMANATSQVRELSHQISHNAMYRPDPISASRIFGRAIALKHIEIRTVLAIVAASNLISPLFKFGVLVALEQAIISSAIALLCLASASMLTKIRTLRFFAFLSVPFIYAAIHAWLQVNFYQPLATQAQNHSWESLFLLNLLLMLSAMLIGSGHGSSKLAGDRLIDEIETTIEQT